MKDESKQALIEISIDYANSFLFQNEKGLWLILNVTSINMTAEPQLTGYAFFEGMLCKNIIKPTPKIQKGTGFYPQSLKTITATADDELFLMAPNEEREDILVVTNLEENRDWHVGIGDIGILVDKSKLHYKTKIE